MITIRKRHGSGIVAWRCSVLRRAGFDPQLTHQLAVEPSIDLHDLLNLVDHGCPPKLAARILAPLRD